MQTGTRSQLEPDTEAQPGSGPPYGPMLTGREQDVMRLLARGQSVADIAEQLGVSTKTVRNNLFRIFPKLGAHRQAEAILVWLRLGLGS